jgi:hypothetical protein
MWHAAHAMMGFADEAGKNEVVIALELSVSIHSARAPAPALLLQGEGVRAKEVIRNQRKECRGVLHL